MTREDIYEVLNRHREHFRVLPERVREELEFLVESLKPAPWSESPPTPPPAGVAKKPRKKKKDKK